tara:strand:- start:18171 stop:20177 length:2007 start_codon:yes stop_codon:yes gene_type:complete
MAETLISPGVLARENDNTFITQQPIQAGAAIVGPAVKGPVEIPTIVTSYSDYQNRFGTTFESGSSEYTYLTSIAAYNYFQNGGNTLLVTRVVSASTNWTSATAPVYNTNESGALDTTTDALLSSVDSGFNITGSSLASVTGISPTGGSGTGLQLGLTLATSESLSTVTVSTAGTGYVVGDILTIPSASAGATKPLGADMTFTLVADDIVDTAAFELESLGQGELFNNSGALLSNGALSNGTSDNIRWQVSTNNTASGTFSLIIRRGNDNTNNVVALETYPELSLDPNSENYISRVIGDQTLNYNPSENYIEVSGSYRNASRYVRVKSVKNTLNYFDNAGRAKDIYTGSIPVVGSGSFSGGVGSNIPTHEAGNYYEQIDGSNTQGLEGSDYNDMLNLLSNADDYKYNLLTLPGLYNLSYSSQITTAINNAQTRGDYMVIADLVKYASPLDGVTNQASLTNSSYAASYWPWVRTVDPDTGKNVWVPASTVIPGVYAFTDNSSEPWFAPAGINRGGLNTVIQAERKLSATNRDTLYSANVNPIATFPGTGIVVYGQKTLQKAASALDRVNVRRLLIALKGQISQIGLNLVFEQNTAATRNNFLAQVNPYLESVQQRQGLYAFRVIMDESNNSPDVIDRNQLVGQIYIQPTRTAEFIYLDFNLQPTGASFPE